MNFVERGRRESLVEHLARNADALVLTDDQRERLHLALQLEVGTWADKLRAGQIASDVDAELRCDLDAVKVALLARGEKTVRYNDAGAMLVKGRDGLGALFASGSLNDAELRIGMAYRFLFEQRFASLGSQLDQRSAGTGGLNGAPAAALLRTYALLRLGKAEAAVMRADPNGDALRVLREVAGQAQSLTSISGKGRPRKRWLAALRLALQASSQCLSCGCGRSARRACESG